MSLSTSVQEQNVPPQSIAPDWSLGWRYERVRRADGREEDGAYFCETVGLRIGLEEGRVWLEDANTGEELLTAQQVSAARDAEAKHANAEAERATAEAERANTEAEARKAAEARAAELEALIAALQQKA